jgi:hypothetical protein
MSGLYIYSFDSTKWQTSFWHLLAKLEIQPETCNAFRAFLAINIIFPLFLFYHTITFLPEGIANCPMVLKC